MRKYSFRDLGPSANPIGLQLVKGGYLVGDLKFLLIARVLKCNISCIMKSERMKLRKDEYFPPHRINMANGSLKELNREVRGRTVP